MANHKSSKKRIRQTAAKRAHNRLYHKTARNAVKALRNTSEKSAATLNPGRMQSQKLPLWQLFYSPAQNNGISHRPASPSTAHTYAPAYRLYDKAVRIAADGFRFSPPGHPRAALPFPGIP